MTQTVRMEEGADPISTRAAYRRPDRAYIETLSGPQKGRIACFRAEKVTYLNPERRRAEIVKRIVHPLVSFRSYTLPAGGELFENVLLSPDPDKTFRALRRYFQPAGEEEIAGILCWVIEGKRACVQEQHPKPVSNGFPSIQDPWMMGEDGSVTETVGASRIRDAVEGEVPSTVVTSRIWIGKRDGIPRRSRMEIRYEKRGGIAQTTDFSVEAGKVTNSLFDFSPPAGTRVVDHSFQATDSLQGKLLSRGDLAPDFDMTTLDGKARRLSDSAGKVLILAFYKAEGG